MRPGSEVMLVNAEEEEKKEVAWWSVEFIVPLRLKNVFYNDCQ